MHFGSRLNPQCTVYMTTHKNYSWFGLHFFILYSNLPTPETWRACVTVFGHSLLSRPVVWRWSSSPIGLGYRCYASTHPFNVLQMAAPGAAIWTHLAMGHPRQGRTTSGSPDVPTRVYLQQRKNRDIIGVPGWAPILELGKTCRSPSSARKHTCMPQCIYPVGLTTGLRLSLINRVGTRSSDWYLVS